MQKIIIQLLILFCTVSCFGQTFICPSNLDFAMMQQFEPARYNNFIKLENFIDSTIASQNSTNSRLINANGIITIPVVVHILHRGEAIGTVRNLSEAQIQSQIDVLNEDFRRLNSNSIKYSICFYVNCCGLWN